jgi:hypothetical protein
MVSIISQQGNTNPKHNQLPLQTHQNQNKKPNRTKNSKG